MIETEEDIIHQLSRIRIMHEEWNSDHDPLDVYEHFTILLDRGNLAISFDDDYIVGYAEMWKLNYAKFGYYIMNGYYDIERLSTTEGNICVVANVCIIPEYRGSYVMADIVSQVRSYAEDCDYIVGTGILSGRKSLSKHVNVRKRG